MATTYLVLSNRVLRELNEVEMTSSNFSSSRGIQTAVKDFVNKSIGIGSRVSVELSPQSAKLLAETIIKALEKGEKDPQIKISVLD